MENHNDPVMIVILYVYILIKDDIICLLQTLCTVIE